MTKIKSVFTLLFFIGFMGIANASNPDLTSEDIIRTEIVNLLEGTDLKPYNMVEAKVHISFLVNQQNGRFIPHHFLQICKQYQLNKLDQDLSLKCL